MNTFKKAAAKVIIGALLLGIVVAPVPLNADVVTTNIVEQKVVSDITPDGVIVTGEATKDKVTMYGRLYITVTWKKEDGGNAQITGIKRAWTTDPYMALQSTSWSASRASAYFYDQTHHTTVSVKLYASEI